MTQQRKLTKDQREAVEFWYDHILDKRGMDTPPLDELIDTAKGATWKDEGEISIHGYIVSTEKMLYLKYYYDQAEEKQR